MSRVQNIWCGISALRILTAPLLVRCGTLSGEARRNVLVFVLIAPSGVRSQDQDHSSWTINHPLIYVSRCLNINNIKTIPSLEARLFLSELLPEWLFLITGRIITIVDSDSDNNSDKTADTVYHYIYSFLLSWYLARCLLITNLEWIILLARTDRAGSTSQLVPAIPELYIWNKNNIINMPRSLYVIIFYFEIGGLTFVIYLTTYRDCPVKISNVFSIISLIDNWIWRKSFNHQPVFDVTL